MKFNKLIPELSVKDITRSKEFYLEILEFQLIYERVTEKFAFISLNGAQIMIENVMVIGKLGNLNIHMVEESIFKLK